MSRTIRIRSLIALILMSTALSTTAHAIAPPQPTPVPMPMPPITNPPPTVVVPPTPTPMPCNIPGRNSCLQSAAQQYLATEPYCDYWLRNDFDAAYYSCIYNALNTYYLNAANCYSFFNCPAPNPIPGPP